jgi:hypothetical protein
LERRDDKVMRATSILLGITFLLGVVSPAGAAIVTVDPDDYAPGTDISTIVPGVTLKAYYATGNHVWALESSLSTSPPENQVFGHSGNDPLWGGADFEYFCAEFHPGTDVHRVSLDFIADDDNDYAPYLTAYKNGGVIPIPGAHATYSGSLAKGELVTLTVFSPTDVIVNVKASWDPKWCQNGELDNLQFENVVPEPSSIVIWSLIGLTCGTLCYRRKRRAAI